MASKIVEGIDQGYGSVIAAPDYTTADAVLQQQLRNNAYVFAAFKSHQEVQQLGQALLNDKGELRSFAEFKQIATKITEQFNVDWLRSEYNLAVANGQMAANWIRIQESKEQLPYLKYQTIGDDRVRDEHRSLDGVLRKVDDSFWDTWYPPNGWGCRCEVIQSESGRETKTIKLPEQKALFKNNVGKSGEVFTAEHPYFKTDEGTKKEITTYAKKINPDNDLSLLARNAKRNLIQAKKQVFVDVDGTKHSIVFTSTGIKEAINQPHKNYYEKNKVVVNADELLKKAKYTSTAVSKSQNPMIKQYHYLEVQIAEEVSYVVLRELTTGQMQFYSIVDALKE